LPLDAPEEVFHDIFLNAFDRCAIET